MRHSPVYRWVLFGYAERAVLAIASAAWLISGPAAGACALIAGTSTNAAACILRRTTQET